MAYLDLSLDDMTTNAILFTSKRKKSERRTYMERQIGAVSTNIQLIQWARRSQALNAANTADTVTGDAALAAGVVLNSPIIDNYFRVRWVIAGTSYTFSVIGILDRD